MNKRWFYRLLFSYLPIFFAVTSILILICFAAISQLSKNGAVQANQTYTKNVIRSIDYSLRTIEQHLLQEIKANTDFEQFLNPRPEMNEYIVGYKVAEKLRDLAILNPLIDSVYIYRFSDGTIITPNSKTHIEQFGDHEFLLMMEKQNIPQSWSSVRLYKEFMNQEDQKSVVSLVRSSPILTRDKGMVVLNVSTSAMKRMINEDSKSTISFINIMDQKGNHVFEPHEVSASEISSLTSDYTGWEFQSGVLDAKLTNTVSILSYVWIGIGLLVTVLGGVWITYITRRNYKPIEVIMARIREYSVKKRNELISGNHLDEFKFIDSALEQIMEQSNKYRKQHEEDLIFRRQYFFQDLIEGYRDISMEEFQSEMSQLYKIAEFEQLAIAIIEIDDVTEFLTKYSYQDQYLLKHTLSSLVDEFAVNQGITVWSEWVTQDRLGVLFQLSQDSKEYPEVMTLLCEKTREWVQGHLSFTITPGLGSCVSHINELSTSYKVALESLQYKTSLGNNRLIGPWDVKSKQRGEMHRTFEVILSIAYSYRLGEADWEAKFEGFFQELSSELYSKEDIVSLMNFLIYHLYQEILKFPNSIQDIWVSETLPNLKAALEKFDTLDDINLQFLSILRDTEERMRKLKEKSSNHNIIQEVREYIHHHYANPDLSLTHVSEEFGLNSNSISRLFKQEFGEKFVNYLMMVRIEQSKKLLLETSEPIQDIAGKVGYLHPMSFIRVFKKIVGMTPGNFRKEQGI